jgi:hypothetical protein
MCKPKDIKEMSVHDMRMSVAEDDLRDAGMLLGYAHAARSHGDETAYKHFAENAEHRIARVEHACGEMRKML